MDESIAELRRICQESRVAPASWYSWYSDRFMRRYSIYVTGLLLRTPITANQITLLSMGAGIVAAMLFALGDYWLSVGGAALMFFGQLLDHVDGEVARYKGEVSSRGKYLDSWSHFIVNPLILVGISFGVYRSSLNPLAFVLGYAASLSRALLYVADFTRKELGASVETKTRNWPSVTSRRTKGRFMSLIERLRAIFGMFMRVMPLTTAGIYVGAVLNRLSILLLAAAIMLPCELAYQLLRMHLDFE